MYQYAWGCASLSLLLVGWALWRTGADVVECAGDEEEFAPAATMVSLSIAGVLYVLAAACVLSAAALHLFSSIGIRAFLSLGVIGYNICMASAGLLVQLTTLGSLGEIRGTLWFRAAFLILWMVGRPSLARALPPSLSLSLARFGAPLAPLARARGSS